MFEPYPWIFRFLFFAHKFIVKGRTSEFRLLHSIENYKQQTIKEKATRGWPSKQY